MMDDPCDPKDIETARGLDAQHEADLRALAGKRIKVIRAVAYEGDALEIVRCLSRSLPPGRRVLSKGGYSITVSQGEPVLLAEPERIEVKRVDLDRMIGITPCDDGSGGWVVMAVQDDPDGVGEVIEPIGDEHGSIVYADILDAAEVLRTGIVWKHDMGEDDEEEPDPPGGFDPSEPEGWDDSTGKE